jgi:DUF1680 family protein
MTHSSSVGIPHTRSGAQYLAQQRCASSGFLAAKLMQRPGENPPPSLFWESDIGKWIEAVCYFLSSTDGQSSPCATEYKACVDELVDMIVSAQQDDGYLNIYFTVVDKEGRLKNLRDLHEMCTSP